jgi:methyl-accepting chemotaxis protein
MQDTLQQRLDFVGLGDAAEERLAPIAESAARHLEMALQHFAARASNTPSAARFLYGRDRIEGDGGGPAAHWQALLAGRLDKGFAEQAMRTGQRHARIGVDPRWQAGSHAIIAQVLVRGIIRDGIATMTRPRRGPLGLLGAPDPTALNDAADALASGVATIVGAVLFDLDLTFSGYVERLRQDGEARLAAQQAQLHQSLEAAGKLLELAAEGRRDDALIEGNEPELAPLRAGAEKLADRVIGLIEDLDLAGRAAEALAAEVLSDGQGLVEHSAAQGEGAQRLVEQLGRSVPHAIALRNGLADLVRQSRALARRCSRQRRTLLALRADAGAQRDPTVTTDLVDRVDALGLAANLAAARLAQGNASGPLDADLRDLALGLAQVSAQLRAVADRNEHAGRHAGEDPARMTDAIEQLTRDVGADLTALVALEREGAALAEGLESALSLSAPLAILGGEGQAALDRLRHVLAEAGALTDLSRAFEDPAPADVPPRAGDPVLPAPDQAALAAHWHVA